MEKISEDRIRQSIVSTLTETFDAMLSMELKAADENGTTGFDGDHVAGTIHFGGQVVGGLTIQLSDPFARTVTCALLGVKPDEIENKEKIKDGIGELATILAENLKTEFLDVGLTCVISIPLLTSGSDFKVGPADSEPPLQLAFRHDDEFVLVDLSVQEDVGVAKDVIRNLTGNRAIKKITDGNIKHAIIDSVIDLFSTMLEMEVKTIQELPDTFVEEARAVASVTLTGEVDGMVSIQINDSFTKQIAAVRSVTDADEGQRQIKNNPEIRELITIIGGNLVSNVADEGLSCVSSLPLIISGRDFSVSPTSIIRSFRCLFSHQDHLMIVEAGIKREETASHQRTDPSENEVRPIQDSPPSSHQAGTGNDVDPFKNLGIVMDIPLPVTVELGRTKKRINDILKMKPQSVIELEQMEGEPVNILVNQILIAKGMVVVENEKYGIRISEIVNRKERLKRIR